MFRDKSFQELNMCMTYHILLIIIVIYNMNKQQFIWMTVLELNKAVFEFPVRNGVLRVFDCTFWHNFEGAHKNSSPAHFVFWDNGGPMQPARKDSVVHNSICFEISFCSLSCYCSHFFVAMGEKLSVAMISHASDDATHNERILIYYSEYTLYSSSNYCRSLSLVLCITIVPLFHSSGLPVVLNTPVTPVGES